MVRFHPSLPMEDVMVKVMRTKTEFLKRVEEVVLDFELDFSECIGIEILFEDKSRYLWTGDKFQIQKDGETNENVK